MGQLEVREWFESHGPATIREMVEDTGWRLETVRKNVYHLQRWGEVRKVGVVPDSPRVVVWGLAD